MTNEQIKNLIEQKLNQSGWTVTNESTEEGDTKVVASK